jgi:hypothetical protein
MKFFIPQRKHCVKLDFHRAVVAFLLYFNRYSLSYCDAHCIINLRFGCFNAYNQRIFDTVVYIFYLTVFPPATLRIYPYLVALGQLAGCTLKPIRLKSTVTSELDAYLPAIGIVCTGLVHLLFEIFAGYELLTGLTRGLR